MGEAVREFLRDSGLDRRLRGRPAFDAWNEVAAADFGDRAKAVAYRRDELVVEVDSAALLQELRGFMGETLRQQVDAAAGETRIRKLTFKLRRTT